MAGGGRVADRVRAGMATTAQGKAVATADLSITPSTRIAIGPGSGAVRSVDRLSHRSELFAAFRLPLSRSRPLEDRRSPM